MTFAAIGRSSSRADVGHHLVAAVAARGDDDRRGPRGRELRERRRPGRRRELRQARVVDDVRRADAATGQPAGQLGRPPRRSRSASTGSPRDAASDSASSDSRSGRAVGVLDEDEDRHRPSTPSRWSSSTTAGAAAAPCPMTSTWLSRPFGQAAAAPSSGRPARRDGVDRPDLLLPRPEPARHATGSAAGSAPPSRRAPPASAARTPPSRRRPPRAAPRRDPSAGRDALDPADDRPAERRRDPDPDLEVAGVGRLVAEQDQVERRRPRPRASRIASAIAPAVA